jgi:hypothetical protein
MRADFPALLTFKRTSTDTWRYNCHAWAADDNARWWQPAPPGIKVQLPPGVRRFWPKGVGALPTVANYKAAFATRDFKDTAADTLDIGVEKIAIYAMGDIALHTARQLPSGRWTSKIGHDIDIEHESPDVLVGPRYGQVIGYMARSTRATGLPTAGTVFRWDPLSSDFVPEP